MENSRMFTLVTGVDGAVAVEASCGGMSGIVNLIRRTH